MPIRKTEVERLMTAVTTNAVSLREVLTHMSQLKQYVKKLQLQAAIDADPTLVTGSDPKEPGPYVVQDIKEYLLLESDFQDFLNNVAVAPKDRLAIILNIAREPTT